MKPIISQKGFTIIELLVGINISFMVITLLISLFLFSIKFASTASKRFTNKVELTTFLFRMDKKLERANDFYLTRLDSSSVFVINNSDSIFFEKKSLRNNYLNERIMIDNYELIINYKKHPNDKLNELRISPKENDLRRYTVIRSPSIQKINLILNKEKKEYELLFLNSNSGIKNFENIEGQL